MFRQTVLHLLAAAPLLGLAVAATARADDAPRVSGPHIHENLSVYLIHGKSADGPVPLTLEEALAKGFVEIHETDTVNSLTIENKSGEEVFIHAGDILKGGKQDRVVTATLILPAKSGPVNASVYCVESGRWSPRGNEDSRKFAHSDAMLPTREAKIAMYATATPPPDQALRNLANRPLRADRTPDIDQRNVREAEQATAALQQRGDSNRIASLTEQQPAGGQGEVWRNVAAIQEKLSGKLKSKVNAAASETSLQLALENDKLAGVQEGYIKALQSVGEKDDDVVGYAIAVNGKIASADVYASNALFRKLWPRLLKTAATEAIGADASADAKAPEPQAVVDFLVQEPGAKPEEATPIAGVTVSRRSVETSYDVETRRTDGKFLHRGKLMR